MEPLKFIQKKDYVSDFLRSKIFLGQIADRTEFTQESVAEGLKISRMPVREAFMQLEQEGFLERLPNRHVQAIGISEKNIYHNFCILSIFEAKLGAFLLSEKYDVTPIKKAFDIYLASLSNETADLCAERELAVHRQFSLQLDDRYISQIHNNMLNGYLACTLKYFPINLQSRAKTLGEVVDTLEKGLSSLLPEKFSIYFTVVEQLIKKEVKK